MDYPNQRQGVLISITFLTKYRTLYKETINSKSSFNDLLENFKKNSQFNTQAKPKDKYNINGKEIKKSQTLEELILQNRSDPNSVELSLELNDLFYSGDTNSSIYKKIIHPKENPFGLFIYSTNGGILNIHNFPEKTINLFELNKINEGSAYCNSNENLYLSGGNDNDNKNFWIINSNDFNIKKKNIPFGKQNHSMIYLNFNENEEWVFIIGGNTKKSFYYDLNKNYFINWGDTNDLHSNPALIKIGEYLYIFDSINTNKNYFERTKLTYPSRKWEKIIPKIDKNLIKNFPSDFGVSYDSNGNILFLGGNNNINMNNTYIYNPLKNEITISQNGTNDNMIFSDKSFYKINNRYNLAFPKNLLETKEICVVDKNVQSMIKINIEIPNVNKSIKIKSKINLDEKNFSDNKNDEGTLTIKDLDIKGKTKKTVFNNQVNNNYTYQMKQPQFICENCQICHHPLKKENYINNKKEIKNPTRQNPYIKKIYDEYYPTLEKRYERKYGNFKENNKVKVEIIYDEYTPIKVDYELGKPYSFKHKKTENKVESINNKEVIQLNKDININNNINANIIKENIQEQKQKIIPEQNECVENNIESNQEKMESYINEEENVEKENRENIEEQQYKENQDENQIEENNEENNEQQNEEEHYYYKHYGQKNKEQNSPHEILRDSLEINDNNKEKQHELNLMNKEIKDDNSDNDLIKPILKLDYGFNEDKNENDEINFDIIQGLKLDFENDKEDKKEEKIIIKEEAHHSIHGEEEEINYENHENEENGMEMNYEQEEEYNVEENEEEMKYEEEEVENEEEEEEKQNSVIELGQEGDNEEQDGENNNIDYENGEEEN